MRTAFGVVALALTLVLDAQAQTTAPPTTTPPAVTAPPPTPPTPPAAPPPATTPPPAIPPAPQVTAPPAGPTGSAPPLPLQYVGKALSLEEAVAIGLAGQPQIQARLFDYAAARYRVTQAISPLLPQITSSVTATRTHQTSLTTTPNSVPVLINRQLDQTLFAQVALSQLLFDFGKTFAATDAARKLATVALESLELQRQLIVLAVREAFTNINFSVRLIAVAQQSFDRAQLNLRSARGFYEVGTRPKSDVARAEVDVANARLDLIRARNAERLARVALATAMGLPATTPLQIQDNLVYQPVTMDRSRLAEEALRMRPEYRQARLNAEANVARLRRAQRDFFPDITGGGFYGAARTDMNEIWELNLSLNWTLFDGGNRIARYREARANLDAAEARVKASELDISREVEQSVNNVIEADERIQAAQVAVVSAQENFRLAQGRFDAGVGTILELTDAQLALTQAQNTEAQALADYRIALARLDRAVGRR